MKAGRSVEGNLGYLLGQANYALYKGFDAQVRAAGLSFIEWRVLAALHERTPLTVSRLAREVLSKQPTVTKLVQRMAEQGWVELQADPADQRCTMVLARGGTEQAHFSGHVEGRLVESLHGTGGFGYDPLFIPEGFDQTFAELGEAIKNRLSHRSRALDQVVAYLL